MRPLSCWVRSREDAALRAMWLDDATWIHYVCIRIVWTATTAHTRYRWCWVKLPLLALTICRLHNLWCVPSRGEGGSTLGIGATWVVWHLCCSEGRDLIVVSVYILTNEKWFIPAKDRILAVQQPNATLVVNITSRLV